MMWATAMVAIAMWMSGASDQPFASGAPASPDGAKRTITRLLEAMQAQDDRAFDQIAKGLTVMLAPDFGATLTRARFSKSLESCRTFHVESSVPMPHVPELQAVRVSMQCRTKEQAQPKEAIMDFMADNDHAFIVFPGGVSKVWPDKPGGAAHLK